jgi:hypothetical protein
MYYIISEDESLILGVRTNMSEEIIQREANDFKCAVYAIQGEHSGYSAEPKTQTQPGGDA